MIVKRGYSCISVCWFNSFMPNFLGNNDDINYDNYIFSINVICIVCVFGVEYHKDAY